MHTENPEILLKIRKKQFIKILSKDTNFISYTIIMHPKVFQNNCQQVATYLHHKHARQNHADVYQILAIWY